MANPAHPSAVSGVFGEPFKEQLAFFRRKLGKLVPTRRWTDMQGAAHDQAFMVAGAVEADLLSDLAMAVDKAISEGRGLDDFRRDFRSIVQRNGWTGWAGEGSVKGEAWRVGVILRTNAYTSYSAGRYAQLVSGDFPIWVYRHGDSREPRIVHLGWDGLQLRPDHLFWVKHYPPSDWECSCYVVGARSEAGARRMGGNPAKKLPAGWNEVDPKTGEPIGIGKGWGYAPGASVANIINAMAGKVSNWDYRTAKQYMSEVPAKIRDHFARSYRGLPSTADASRSLAGRTIGGNPGEQDPAISLGLLTGDQAKAARANVPADLDHVDPTGFDFSINADAVRHIIASHGDSAGEANRGQIAVEAQDFALLPQLLNRQAPRYHGLSDNVPTFETTGEVDGRQITALWKYWPRRKTLALLTMWIR